MTLKIAVVAPVARASEAAATKAKPGFRSNVRDANRTSRPRSSNQGPKTGGKGEGSGREERGGGEGGRGK